MSFHNETVVTNTRKEYTCDGCLEKILIGSQAKRGAGRFNGEFYSYIICTQCNKFLDENSGHFIDGWSEGDIAEAIREQDGRL